MKSKLLLMVVLLAPVLFAQVGTDGSILGSVRDQSGAPIPGAEVRVTNLETGLVQTARTNAEGNFDILALPRGFYSVSASAPQFTSWELASIELTVGEQKRISPMLRVGDVKQQVTVEGGVELVQTEKASVESVIEETQIRELPLNGRDAVELVMLTPGMRYIGAGGVANEHTVQGVGVREDQTGFSIDGQDANDPSNEKGTSIPNVDTIAQFSVQTSNFTAENGRNPVQVLMVTKGGTNQFHGTLWEFHRNAKFDAQNYFAPAIPKLIRNQFGFSVGGPIIRNRTFFFISDEWLKIRRERIYNADTVTERMLEGNFSGRRTITDPTTGRPFPDNTIPGDRISAASRFFFPYLLRPNSAGNLFRAVAPQTNDNSNLTLRVDQQLTPAQRVYVRWIRIGLGQGNPGYKPDLRSRQDLVQQNVGLNYNWTLTPATLFTLAGGYLQSVTVLTSPDVGRENLTQKAGIQGFPTEGREESVGLPNVSFTGGYAGFSMPQQIPARFARQDLGGKASMSLVRGGHTIGFGYEFNDRRTGARHSSTSARGTFAFNGQYTGDGFADFLLGLLSSGERNYPLATFGMAHSPYSAGYVQDFWRAHRDISLTLGLRYDRWHEKRLVRNIGATFDPRRGKIIAADNGGGSVDLTAQPVAPYLAASTSGLWMTATEAGVPRGLFQSTGLLSPRLGATWRPFGREGLVLRAGYGIYTSSFNGNITGSQVISPPYWAQERVAFTRTSPRQWEQAFPADPRAFITSAVAAAAYDVRPMKIHQFNFALQKSIPWVRSAVTISYVGNRG
ncbi:MAG TPA: TonB-dependent receptor, partial [Bryobacteraceae bacterium]|nr:TonB-dependent receptor [Bryobacteraceae bacterium]